MIWCKLFFFSVFEMDVEITARDIKMYWFKEVLNNVVHCPPSFKADIWRGSACPAAGHSGGHRWTVIIVPLLSPFPVSKIEQFPKSCL